MSYIYKCSSQLLVQFADLAPHLCSELGIQVRERFVEEEHLRISYHSSSERYSLTLSAGESLRLSVQVRLQPEN